MENRVGHPDLADVVHRRRVQQGLALGRRQADDLAEMGTDAAHARDVAPRLGVVQLGDLPEPVDDLELGVAQVLGALANAPLEHPVVADDELLLVDQHPREDAEHPPDRLRMRGEHRVEVLGADLDGLARLDGDDRRRPRRAVEHGELTERVTRAQAREDVALDALRATHLERPRTHEVHGVAGRALLEHGLPRGIAPPPRTLSQRVERRRRQAREQLAAPQVRFVNRHNEQCGRVAGRGTVRSRRARCRS